MVRYCTLLRYFSKPRIRATPCHFNYPPLLTVLSNICAALYCNRFDSSPLPPCFSPFSLPPCAFSSPPSASFISTSFTAASSAISSSTLSLLSFAHAHKHQGFRAYVIGIKNSREIWTTTIAVKNDGWCSQLWCYLARWKVFPEAGKRTFILRKLEKERKGTACERRKATQHVYETKECSKRKVSTVLITLEICLFDQTIVLVIALGCSNTAILYNFPCWDGSINLTMLSCTAR